MCIVSPALSATACATTPGAIVSSFVAPVDRVVAIACCPMCAAIVALCSALSWSAATFATASAATCCLLSSLAARLSRCVWSSASIEGSVLCPVRCYVSNIYASNNSFQICIKENAFKRCGIVVKHEHILTLWAPRLYLTGRNCAT